MAITIDLNKQAKSIASQPTNTPEGLKLAVLNNFTIAVNQLAKKSSLSYSLDAPTLQRVLNAYLEQNPTHNNPLNIVLHETKKQAEAQFYDLSYRFEGMPAKPTFFNKHPEEPGEQRQGMFEHIPELNAVRLVDGKITYASDNMKEEGKWQYIPELKTMQLVDGKVTFANGVVHEGKIQYIPELKGTSLVDGKATFASGKVKEGKFQYIPELKGTYLVDGKITHPNGQQEEGKFAYIKGLNRMAMVDGTLTHADSKRVDTGRFEYIAGIDQTERYS